MPDHGATAARPHVVVVGGGFGGLAAVRHLRRAPVDVTLVDRTNHHLFQPLLYQVATGLLSPGEIAPPLRAITRRQTNTTVRLAEVTGIDVERRRVQLCGADGRTHAVSYDHLIVAAGARDSYFGHDDWARHVYPMKTLAQAVVLRDRILGAYERAAVSDDPQQQARWGTFVIVGGGPTGVEVAGQLVAMARHFAKDFRWLATRPARILLVEAGSDLLASFSSPSRAHAQRTLAAMGVEVRLSTKAVNVEEHAIDVQAHDGQIQRIDAGTVIWAAGVQASPLGAVLGQATGATLDHGGRVEVRPDCSLHGHPEVFAIGDVANLDNLPGLAEPAMQEGAYVADLIRRRVTGRAAPGAFRYRDLGTMATISADDAVAETFGVRPTGVPAKLAWATVHVAFLTGWGNRGGVLARWAYELGTHRRPERVILEGVGAGDALGRLAHRDAPAVDSITAGRT